MAQAVLHAMRARGAFDWPKDSPAPIIDPAQCAAHFGLGPGTWRYVCLWGIMFYDLAYPIRYDPSRRLEKRLAFATAAKRIDAGEAPEALGLPNVGIPEPVPTVSAGIFPGGPPKRAGGTPRTHD